MPVLVRVSRTFSLDEEEVPLSSESPDVTGLELVPELELEFEFELELELELERERERELEFERELDLVSILSELNDAS